VPGPRAPEPDAPAAEALRVPEVPEPVRPDQEQSAYQLLWSVVRVHREMEERHLARIAELEEEVLVLREENTQLTGGVASWLSSYRPDVPVPARTRRPVVTSRHLALEDASKAFTYPLPAELPESRA
jgi:hypothetical protein